MMNKQCPEAMGTEYQSQETAYSKCDSDPSCFAIYDRGCKGQTCRICTSEARWKLYPKAQERVDRLASIKS